MSNILFFISCIEPALLLIVCIFYIKLRIKNKSLRSDLNKIILAVKRVRYGDVNVRIENLDNKELENVINRLFETLYDREMMIKEYQSTLADKNLSLEEIIKNEKQISEFKDEFAATLTHDMKVPVIAELNSLNYLIEGRFGELNTKQLGVLQLMKSSNQELKNLIENLVETYKLEKKSLELNITSNNFNEFLDGVILEMRPIISVSGHNINVDYEKTKNKKFDFDFFQLKRVVKNLLQNAVIYSQNSCDIKIKTDFQADNFNFMIINKGTGISKEELELVFRKYYSGYSKLKSSGTGLGLYISRQIVLAHNGEITAESNTDGYTSFIVTIPQHKK